MENITFETSALVSLGVEATVLALLPIIVMIVWKKKTGSKFKPFIVGAVTFFLFAVILKLIPAYFLFYADNPVANAINNNIWLYYLTAGILAGIFEETGRYTAYKTVLKNSTDKITAVSYGIGHGGFESIYLAYSILIMLIMGITVNSGGLEQITDGLEGEQLETALSQLKEYSQITFSMSLLGIWERITTIILHICLSVFVFTAAHQKKYFLLFPAAILIHTLIDFSVVLTKLAPPIIFEVILFIFSVLLLVFTYKFIYNNIKTMQGKTR